MSKFITLEQLKLHALQCAAHCLRKISEITETFSGAVEELDRIKADKPTVSSVTFSTDWTNDSGNIFTQAITIPDATANSKVSLQPDATVINQMLSDGVLALYIVNDYGALTAYAIGAAPTVELTVQVTIADVDGAATFTDPVLENDVLGITQAQNVTQTGDTIRIT